MKILIAFLFPALLLITNGWLNDFNEAKHQAFEKKELILLNFSGSDWCSPCIQLKKNFFESDVFKEYAATSLILVNADFPRLKKNRPSKSQVTENENLAEIYNAEGKFPLTLLLDANGKVLRIWDGLPDLTPAQFVGEVKAYTDAPR